MLTQKAGQGSTSQSDLTDQLSSTSQTQTSSATTTSTSQPDYVPQVGDVVEFEYNGKPGKGLIFSYDCELRIWHNGDFDGRVVQGSVSDSGKKLFQKIGSCEITIYTSYDDSRRIAKAYFSAPTFKVGDRVRNTVGNWEGKVIEIAGCKIKVFGTSCSSWYEVKYFVLALEPA